MEKNGLEVIGRRWGVGVSGWVQKFPDDFWKFSGKFSFSNSFVLVYAFCISVVRTLFQFFLSLLFSKWRFVS